MTKVTSRSCPTCGHEKGSPQTFEVAEVPVVRTEELTGLLEAVKGLPAQFPKPPELPPNLAETLEKVAQAGEHMHAVSTSWEAQKKAEAETSGHSVPTPEDIEHFRTCPNCAPGWQKIWDEIAASAREGYMLASDAQEAMTEIVAQFRGAKQGV